MKIKKILFPFLKYNSFLKDKWWHRLFVVFYNITVVAFLIVAFFVAYSSISETPFNTKIINNLRDFSKNSDKSMANTVPSFLKQGQKIGCFEDGKYNYVSTYSLQHETFCSSDLSSHLDEAAQVIMGDDSLTFERRKEALSEALTNDKEKRYCFIRKQGVDCLSNNIISYNKNIIFYLQVIASSFLTAYLFSLFLQLLYFKGLIYIIYGKKPQLDN